MKKLLFTAAIAVLGFTSANAQEEVKTFGFAEGDVIVEGNLGFNATNNKNTEVKSSAFGVNPKVGYFLSDDLAIGLELNYNSNKTTNDLANTEAKASRIGGGLFARYYFLDLGQRFKTYAEFGAGYDSTKNENTVASVTSEAKSNGLGAGLSLGMNYFVGENFAINFGLSDVLAYRTDKADATGAKAVSSFGGNLNVFNNFFQTAQFGMTFKF